MNKRSTINSLLKSRLDSRLLHMAFAPLSIFISIAIFLVFPYAPGAPAAHASASASASAPGLAATPYTLGSTVSGAADAVSGGWYSIAIESDGLYKVSMQARTDPAVVGSRIKIHDSKGNIEFFEGDSGYSIIDSAENARGDMRVREYTIYMHEGVYAICIYGSIGHNNRGTIDYSFSVESIDAPYGEDKEPNDTSAGAVALAMNAAAGGVLGGVRDDGSGDSVDVYALSIPAPMNCEFQLTADRAAASLGVYDSAGAALLSYAHIGNTAHNVLDDNHRASFELEFARAGTYYVRVTNAAHYGGYSNPYNPYTLLVTGDGSAAGAASSSQRVSSLRAAPTAVGVIIYWSPAESGDSSGGGSVGGYRIFRDGVPLNSEPAFGGSYVDIGADSNTSYTYAVQPFELGDAQEEGVLTETVQTGEIDVPADAGGFIVMQLDNDMMNVNGETMEIDPGRGTVPTTVNGRTMAPIRAIVEAMGGDVGWDEADRRVSLDVKGHSIVMWLERSDILVDGAPASMDVAPATINERTMLPVRFVAENADCAIEWIGSTQEIVIVY